MTGFFLTSIWLEMTLKIMQFDWSVLWNLNFIGKLFLFFSVHWFNFALSKNFLVFRLCLKKNSHFFLYFQLISKFWIIFFLTSNLENFMKIPRFQTCKATNFKAYFTQFEKHIKNECVNLEIAWNKLKKLNFKENCTSFVKYKLNV
jgi:hypothetical protein